MDDMHVGKEQSQQIRAFRNYAAACRRRGRRPSSRSAEAGDSFLQGHWIVPLSSHAGRFEARHIPLETKRSRHRSQPHQFASTPGLRMSGDDLLGQRCARARHADDEHRHIRRIAEATLREAKNSGVNSSFIWLCAISERGEIETRRLLSLPRSDSARKLCRTRRRLPRPLPAADCRSTNELRRHARLG